MFEQIKSEIGNMPVRIEYINGKIQYGIIIDFIEQEKQDISSWKFIAYNNLLKYESTENPCLFEKIEENKVASIDLILK